MNRETILHEDGESIVPVKVAKRPGGTSTAKSGSRSSRKYRRLQPKKTVETKTEIDAESEILNAADALV